MSRWVLLLGILLSGAAQASVNAGCSLFGGQTTYAPLQSWPFDSVRIQVVCVPFCTNFVCQTPPKLVGTVAQVEGTTIKLDIFGSDDALPAGVPASPRPTQGPYVSTVGGGVQFYPHYFSRRVDA